MANKLILKFLVGIVAAVLWSFLAISLIVSSLSYKKALQNKADELYKVASSIATKYGNDNSNEIMSLENLTWQCDTISKYTGADIMYIFPSGSVAINTSKTKVSNIPDFDPTDIGKNHYNIGKFYGIYNSEHLTTFYPVTIKSYFGTRGYIIVSIPTKTIHSQANSIFNYNYLSFGITLALFSIIVYIFIRNISLPLRKLNEASKQYANGNFAYRVKVGGSDEIGQLSASLEYMAEKISDLNSYQQKLVANVSHDFRSPLTSIKGYLEAMLDGTIPPELHEKYINIVLSETERLTKLTNNILTINNMNSDGALLNYSDFDIVDTIKHTIEGCEGVCLKKGIKFKLVFSDKQLMVHADHDKIQQVIYNLIDNAIKFSPNDSSIIVSATEKSDKIILSIKDFGVGIPKDSISKIWNRFYKTDQSRGKDKKGTGLGLSIVKDIINAHHEYIDVISTEGVGTEFSFALQKTKEPEDL